MPGTVPEMHRRLSYMIKKYSYTLYNDEIHSEKYVVRGFHHSANVLECTYTNLDGVAYYTPRYII